MTMFDYDFMRAAFAAATIVAILSAATGWFLVLRGQSFAGHALAHLGFAGAAGALLLGIQPIWGLLFFSMLGGGAMGLAGENVGQRDISIGMVLAVALGLGMLFLHLLPGAASATSSLLFGNVLGVDRSTLWILATLGVLCTAVLCVIARPLLFASLLPDVAAARGVPVRVLSVVFLLLVAIVTAQCSQVTGVLLVFTLMIGPAATMHKWGASPVNGVIGAVLLALFQSWGGIILSWYTDAPTSFWISFLSGLCYVTLPLCRRGRDTRSPV